MKCTVIKRYADGLQDRWVEVGEIFFYDEDRAKFLEDKGFVKVEPAHIEKKEVKKSSKREK